MKTLIAVALLLLAPFAAIAQDASPSDLVAEWRVLHQECRIGETATDATLSIDQSDRSCQRLEKVRDALLDASYCWDASEFEWVAPGNADTSGKVCPAP